jgi:hypothetical protein
MELEKAKGSKQPRKRAARKTAPPPKRSAAARVKRRTSGRTPGSAAPRPSANRARPRANAAASKAAFVRAQPLSLSAKDVVAAAARLGMSMTADYVHKVRSTAKARAAGPQPAVAPARKAAPDPARKAAPKLRPLGLIRAGTPDAAFRKLVLELGLQRAKDLLSEVERKLAALIGGS